MEKQNILACSHKGTYMPVPTREHLRKVFGIDTYLEKASWGWRDASVVKTCAALAERDLSSVPSICVSRFTTVTSAPGILHLLLASMDITTHMHIQMHRHMHISKNKININKRKHSVILFLMSWWIHRLLRNWQKQWFL